MVAFDGSIDGLILNSRESWCHLCETLLSGVQDNGSSAGFDLDLGTDGGRGMMLAQGYSRYGTSNAPFIVMVSLRLVEKYNGRSP